MIDLNVAGKSTVGGLVAFPQVKLPVVVVEVGLVLLEVGLAGWLVVCNWSSRAMRWLLVNAGSSKLRILVE